MKKKIGLVIVVTMLMCMLTGCTKEVELELTSVNWEYTIHIQHEVVRMHRSTMYPYDNAGYVEVREEWNDVLEEYETVYWYSKRELENYRKVVTNGTDKNPYFGELQLKYDDIEGSHDKVYWVTGKDANGKTDSYYVSESDWQRLEAGDKIYAVVEFGTITEILD